MTVHEDMTDDYLLELENVSYSYRTRRAVNEVSLGIRRGEAFGLLGPNGAGKTTLISCIAGLLQNWSGSMEFDGQPFTPAHKASDRYQIGFVPQELAIYPNLSAEENLLFFGRLVGLRGEKLRKSVADNLDLAGLTERRHDLVRTYSGGMQRRLNLTSGLLHSPSLLLLDEPTVGVDPQSRNHIFECLRHMRDAGHTLIYTTHYMEEVQRLCDRIAIMHQGQIVALGAHSELAISIGNPQANLEEVFLHLTGRSLRDE
ncbi:MAG: ABC transporter ATP-binding protein [Planctomycetales bacterium]|nr:ABC transporter ATP-binding protein [Planctomycetales bacterium]